MKSWPTRPLRDVATVIRGVSFDKRQVGYEPKKNSIPILRAGNIRDSLLTDSDLIYVPEELVREEQRMRRGDLAVCMSSGSAAVVGKTAHLENDWSGSVGAFCAIVRFNGNLHHRLGSYWFRSPAFLQWRDSKAQGANIQNLRRTELEALSIPVPPMAAQKRIVKLLDESDELRKRRAQADHRTAELIPALFHEMFESPHRVPVKPLDQLAAVVSGVAKGRKFNGEKPVTVAYLRVANVQAGYLDLTELKTIEALPREVEELSLKKGDVLLTEGGDFDKLGRGAMLDQDLPNCIHQNHVFRVRCEQSQLLPEYFASFLLAQNARLYFLRCAKKTSNLASINMTQLRALPVPVPPLPLQKGFAERLREIRGLESTQVQSRIRLDALFASLLDKAFKGEL